MAVGGKDGPNKNTAVFTLEDWLYKFGIAYVLHRIGVGSRMAKICTNCVKGLGSHRAVNHGNPPSLTLLSSVNDFPSI